MTTSGSTRVAICIASYRRPEGLTRLLLGLNELVFPRTGVPELQVVLVDNDPEGSARAVYDRVRPEVRWALRYEHEPQRGLSYVRNRAVNVARERAELIAFIDDDEVPTPTWLDELLYAQQHYDADVVLGPMLRLFESEVAPWIARGGFFEEPRYPTGTRLVHGSTGNALIHTRAIAGMPEPFDHRWAITGGEDTHLFVRLHDAGRRIIWADEAVVHEFIPESRANAGWILRRVYRTSTTWGLCERELRPSIGTAAKRAAAGVLRISYGLASLPVSWLFGRHRMVRSLWYVCVGAGHLAGMAGMRYHEYRVTHGK